MSKYLLSQVYSSWYFSSWAKDDPLRSGFKLQAAVHAYRIKRYSKYSRFFYSESISCLPGMAFKCSFKLLTQVCQIEILEISFCAKLTLNVECSLPLDAVRRPMSQAEILIYSMDVRSRLMIDCYLILLLDDSGNSSRSYANQTTYHLWFERS